MRLSVSVKSPVPIRHLVTEDYRRLRDLGPPMVFTIRCDNWSGRTKRADLPGAMRLRPIPKKKSPCSMLRFGATVHADGNFTLCGCRDLEGNTDLALGNVKDRSIKELWTSPKAHMLRETFTEKTPDICRDCAQFSSISNIGDWEMSLIRAIKSPPPAC